jgi:glycosyltransferase involved in cell wall biosynthesis
VVLCLSGTDIYGVLGSVLVASMREADLLVVLQEKAVERVPEEFRAKTRVIVQGAERNVGVEKKAGFQVCVVGHLREVKDPLRTARAARLLPAESSIKVVQAGAILELEFGGLVELEMKENARYHWVGELSLKETRQLIAESQVMVLSSRSEGGPRVVGEAVVEGTPVLSSRIDGVVGLLGEDYPGYFEVGDTEGLARLLEKVELDAGFREELRAGVAKVAGKFDVESEKVAWKELLEDVDLLSEVDRLTEG